MSLISKKNKSIFKAKLQSMLSYVQFYICLKTSTFSLSYFTIVNYVLGYTKNMSLCVPPYLGYICLMVDKKCL